MCFVRPEELDNARRRYEERVALQMIARHRPDEATSRWTEHALNSNRLRDWARSVQMPLVRVKPLRRAFQ
jgi:hypothetical protein